MITSCDDPAIEGYELGHDITAGWAATFRYSNDGFIVVCQEGL